MNLFATPKETGKHWEIWNSRGENLLWPIPKEAEPDATNRLTLWFLAQALSKAEQDVTRVICVTTYDNGNRHCAAHGTYNWKVLPKPDKDKTGLKDF